MGHAVQYVARNITNIGNGKRVTSSSLFSLLFTSFFTKFKSAITVYTYESIGCCRGLSSFQLLLFIHFMFLWSSPSLCVSFCLNDRSESTANGFLAQFERNEPNKIVKRPRSDLFTTTNQLDSCPLLVSTDCVCQTWVIVGAAAMVMRSICVVRFGHANATKQSWTHSVCAFIIVFSHSSINLHNSEGRFCHIFNHITNMCVSPSIDSVPFRIDNAV